MLVLQRKPGEKIRMGNSTISIAKVQGNRVSVAIDAPSSIKVYREEIAPTTPSKSLEDELAEALQLLLGGMRMPDTVSPATHQMLHVKHEHVAKAEAVVAKWMKGGDQ